MLNSLRCRASLYLKPCTVTSYSYRHILKQHRRSMSTVIHEVDKSGAFVRKESVFRNWIKEGSDFPPESGRYHLFISHACPWANRTAIGRELKGLQDVITISPVDWLLAEGGWRFTEEYPDPLFGSKFLREIYRKSDPEYEGKVTVPVLFDKKTNKIVSNESAEILRMLNDQFNAWAKNPTLDLYPEPLRAQIDDLNSWIYPHINNAVYRCGFAQSQESFEVAFKELFEALDKVEDILSKSRYLTGDQITEADVRLFTTLVRFDPVYATHFKCNKKRLIEYPNIFAFTRDMYQTSTIKNTINLYHIKHHYFESHVSINPFKIVPPGFDIDYSLPHDRNTKFISK